MFAKKIKVTSQSFHGVRVWFEVIQQPFCQPKGSILPCPQAGIEDYWLMRQIVSGKETLMFDFKLSTANLPSSRLSYIIIIYMRTRIMRSKTVAFVYTHCIPWLAEMVLHTEHWYITQWMIEKNHPTKSCYFWLLIFECKHEFITKKIKNKK